MSAKPSDSAVTVNRPTLIWASGVTAEAGVAAVAPVARGRAPRLRAVVGTPRAKARRESETVMGKLRIGFAGAGKAGSPDRPDLTGKLDPLLASHYPETSGCFLSTSGRC